MNGVLPIGSVVLLKDSTKRLMVVGVCQKSAANQDKIYDYVGVVFPEGFIAPDKMFLFNNDQIDVIYSVGYQDQEQMAFKEKADAAIAELRSHTTED